MTAITTGTRVTLHVSETADAVTGTVTKLYPNTIPGMVFADILLRSGATAFRNTDQITAVK